VSDNAGYEMLIGDLEQEQEGLARMVEVAGEAGWCQDTAAAGWKVRDQVFHLARFDELSALSITDTRTFESRRDAWIANVDRARAREVELAVETPRAEVLDWWASSRSGLIRALLRCTASERVQWWGPSMSARSFATARLMETWAHGWEIAEALGGGLAPTDRIRHVVQLGFITRSWSYVNRGSRVPSEPVRLVLTAPSSAVWTWGDPDAAQTITGDALDFALVVTQRRHVDDTGLLVTGADARDWMLIAQCFAGPASTVGRGR